MWLFPYISFSGCVSPSLQRFIIRFSSLHVYHSFSCFVSFFRVLVSFSLPFVFFVFMLFLHLFCVFFLFSLFCLVFSPSVTWTRLIFSSFCYFISLCSKLISLSFSLCRLAPRLSVRSLSKCFADLLLGNSRGFSWLGAAGGAAWLMGKRVYGGCGRRRANVLVVTLFASLLGTSRDWLSRLWGSWSVCMIYRRVGVHSLCRAGEAASRISSPHCSWHSRHCLSLSGTAVKTFSLLRPFRSPSAKVVIFSSTLMSALKPLWKTLQGKTEIKCCSRSLFNEICFDVLYFIHLGVPDQFHSSCHE